VSHNAIAVTWATVSATDQLLVAIAPGAHVAASSAKPFSALPQGCARRVPLFGCGGHHGIDANSHGRQILVPACRSRFRMANGKLEEVPRIETR
jgi:hypothetical protein